MILEERCSMDIQHIIPNKDAKTGSSQLRLEPMKFTQRTDQFNMLD